MQLFTNYRKLNNSALADISRNSSVTESPFAQLFSTLNMKIHPSRQNNLHIIDIRVMYEHSKGKILILPKNITFLV